MSDQLENLKTEDLSIGDRPLSIPSELPILPLRDTVLFPNSFMPLAVARESSVRRIDDAIANGKLIAVFTQRDAALEEPGQADLYPVGTATHIHKMFKLPDGSLRLIVQGLARLKLDEVVSSEPYLRARVSAATEGTKEVEELQEKIEAAGMPETVKKEALRELDRLSKMPVAAAEYTVSRTYLDWLVALPWAKRTDEVIDLPKTKSTLDADHSGLERAKDRILEYLAVRKLNPDVKGPILCFVGPPGVGKTSLARSIAESLGRKFVRVSLGGMRDEAEIRGHRRTYIGALPGQVIQGLRRAESKNPVFILDEIDKLGSDFRGDPASALLEVLDPEQNNSFRDHYLDVPFDLSEVLFLTTANVMDPIPPALRDRMEVLELAGYTEEEKLKIAFEHLVAKQVKNHGLTEEQ